jgi:hypothetical protein
VPIWLEGWTKPGWLQPFTTCFLVSMRYGSKWLPQECIRVCKGDFLICGSTRSWDFWGIPSRELENNVHLRRDKKIFLYLVCLKMWWFITMFLTYAWVYTIFRQTQIYWYTYIYITIYCIIISLSCSQRMVNFRHRRHGVTAMTVVCPIPRNMVMG